MINARTIAIATMLVCLCSTVASAAVPVFSLGAPWKKNAIPSGKSTAEWYLPRLLPHQTDDNTQFVDLFREEMEEGGFGEFVADKQTGMDQDHNISAVHFERLDDCLSSAWYFTYQQNFEGIQRTLDWVFMSHGTSVYEAVYIRPADQPEDPVAHAAILAYCNS